MLISIHPENYLCFRYIILFQKVWQKTNLKAGIPSIRAVDPSATDALFCWRLMNGKGGKKVMYLNLSKYQCLSFCKMMRSQNSFIWIYDIRSFASQNACIGRDVLNGISWWDKNTPKFYPPRQRFTSPHWRNKTKTKNKKPVPELVLILFHILQVGAS